MDNQQTKKKEKKKREKKGKSFSKKEKKYLIILFSKTHALSFSLSSQKWNPMKTSSAPTSTTINTTIRVPPHRRPMAFYHPPTTSPPPPPPPTPALMSYTLTLSLPPPCPRLLSSPHAGREAGRGSTARRKKLQRLKKLLRRRLTLRPLRLRRNSLLLLPLMPFPLLLPSPRLPKNLSWLHLVGFSSFCVLFEEFVVNCFSLVGNFVDFSGVLEFVVVFGFLGFGN